MESLHNLQLTAPASTLLHQITVFAKDWRDSKIGPELRAAGIGRCRLKVDGHTVHISITPIGAPPFFKALGQVDPLPHAPGSKLAFTIQESWFCRFTGVMWTGFPLYGWLKFNSNQEPTTLLEWTLVLVGSLLLFLTYRFVVARGRLHFAEQVKVLFRHIAGLTASAT